MADSITLIVKGEKALTRGFENLANEINQPREPLTKTGRFMQMEAFANFPAEGGVFGEKWPPLKPSTIKRKAKDWAGRPMMVRTGKLFSSFRVQEGQKFVRIYNPVSYAIEHQYGIGKNLPRRVLLKLAKKQRDNITDIFVNWIKNSIIKSFK